MPQQCVVAAVVVHGFEQLYMDYGPGQVTSSMSGPVLACKDMDGSR
jgi:hypothetical protein